MLMPEHIHTCFVVFTSLHHNLITGTRGNANLLQARAGPNQQNAIWAWLRSYNYSLFPWFHPVWIWPKAQQLTSVAHLKTHPYFISVWSKLNVVHQLSERCIYEDFESINPLKIGVNIMAWEHRLLTEHTHCWSKALICCIQVQKL